MISLKLKEAYDNLDLDDKRNKLSNELLVMEGILKNIQNRNGLVSNFEVKNYESGSNMTEDEFLSFIYEDIFEIQKQLILLADKINIKR
ncbi:MAG: hypothetical protein MSS28_03705 [Tenericutes bacterium]|nr:hypothetical protein [Mycoplasmatota bacterium]